MQQPESIKYKHINRSRIKPEILPLPSQSSLDPESPQHISAWERVTNEGIIVGKENSYYQESANANLVTSHFALKIICRVSQENSISNGNVTPLQIKFRTPKLEKMFTSPPHKEIRKFQDLCNILKSKTFIAPHIMRKKSSKTCLLFSFSRSTSSLRQSCFSSQIKINNSSGTYLCGRIWSL